MATIPTNLAKSFGAPDANGNIWYTDFPTISLNTPTAQGDTGTSTTTSGAADAIQKLITSLNTPISATTLQGLTPTVETPAAIQAPTINLPTNNLLGNIQQASQQTINAGIDALRGLFKPKYESERERLASQGLVGSGVETEALRRLTQEQGIQERQYINEQTAKMMEAQVAELQSLRDLQFEAAIKQGDWSQAAQIETSRLRSESEQMKLTARQIANQTAEIQLNATNNALQAQLSLIDQDLQRQANEIQRSGTVPWELQLELEEKRNFVAAAQAAGTIAASSRYEGGSYEQYVNDLLERWGYSDIGSLSSTTGTQGPSAVAKPTTSSSSLPQWAQGSPDAQRFVQSTTPGVSDKLYISSDNFFRSDYAARVPNGVVVTDGSRNWIKNNGRFQAIA